MKNNKLDLDYQALLQDILDNGHRKGDRTGTGTISVFGRQIRHKMSDGFPLLTTKKMHFKSIATELVWFLRGETNIKFLVDNDCNIWNGDAYKSYVQKETERTEKTGKTWTPLTIEEFVNKIKTDDEFAKKWGDLGPVYGKQWRGWNQFEEYKNKFEMDIAEENEDYISFSMGTKGMVYEMDQIANLIHELKTNPDSRRLMVNAWNVGELDQMTLPPCHYGFQVYTRELSLEERKEFAVNKHPLTSPDLMSTDSLNSNNIPTRTISLMWNQRSCDVPLGIPYNIASYALLLEIIGKMVNMVPDELIGNLGDCHIYLNQIEGCQEQIGRELRIDERVCMCYENPNLDLSKLREGMSDDEFTKVCDEFGIPTRSREPYELPNLVFSKTDDFFRELGDDLSLLSNLDISDFMVENYQSHPTIKFPLSN